MILHQHSYPHQHIHQTSTGSSDLAKSRDRSMGKRQLICIFYILVFLFVINIILVAI